MATPSSYPLTNLDIEAEFGSTVDTSGECLGLGGAPSSYPLTSADMLGRSSGPAETISIAMPTSASATNFSGTARVTVTFSPDGTWDIDRNPGTTTHGDWCSPKPPGNNYEIKFRKVNGTVSGGANNVWVAHTTEQDVYVTSASGVISGSLEVQIRKTGTTTVLATDTIQLTAEVSGGVEF